MSFSKKDFSWKRHHVKSLLIHSFPYRKDRTAISAINERVLKKKPKQSTHSILVSVALKDWRTIKNVNLNV